VAWAGGACDRGRTGDRAVSLGAALPFAAGRRTGIADALPSDTLVSDDGTRRSDDDEATRSSVGTLVGSTIRGAALALRARSG